MKKLAQNKKIFTFLFIASASLFFLNPNCAFASLLSYWSGWDGIKFLAGAAGSAAGWTLEKIFEFLLIQVLIFVSWLLPLAIGLLNYIIDPQNILMILQADAIKNIWMLVRDTLNIAFIFVLVFSAFCTIFQIEKYNYKKILLNLVLMALLVNFSFPITRFIIDVSNSLMYTIASSLFGSYAGTGFETNMFGILARDSNLQQFFLPQGVSMGQYPISLLIAAIVFVFIFGVTLLSFSVILVIRIVALAILIIFSPIGFVGSIFPDTNSFSGKFWDNLFRYCFVGPLMLFTLFIAMKLMEEISVNSLKSLETAMSKQVVADVVPTVAAMAFHFIPIVILWIGMGIAQSMSIEGASAVTGKAKGFLSWAGKNLSGYNALKWGTKAGIKAGAQKFDRDILAPRGYSPRAFKKAWEARHAEVENRKLNVAGGKFRDRLNMFFDGAKTDYEQLEKDRLVTNREKEMKESTEHSSILLNQASQLAGQKTAVARRDWKAVTKILWHNRDQDELMKFIQRNYEKEGVLGNGETFKSIGIKEDELGVTGWNCNQAMARILESCGETPDQIAKHIVDVQEIAAGNGGVGYGYNDYNDKGELEQSTNKFKQAHISIKKLATTAEGQSLVRQLHRNNFVDEKQDTYIRDADGKIKEDADGNQMQGKIIMIKNADGTDSDTPVMEDMRDKHGDLVFEKDALGNAVYETDAHGNFIFEKDKNGKDVKKRKRKQIVARERRVGISPEFTELVRSGLLSTFKEHVARHNTAVYEHAGSEVGLRSLREHIDNLYREGAGTAEDPDHKHKITEAQYKVADEWLKAFETFVKTGKKGGSDKKDDTKKKDEEPKPDKSHTRIDSFDDYQI